jgi:alkaline phosphatase
MEDEIARQMIGDTHPLGRMVDLMIGGGRCHFLPNTTEGSCRADDVDVVKTAQQAGWNYISSRKEFDGLGDAAPLPLLALLAPTDIPYEIDRQHHNDMYPSLEESARTALKALSAATKDTDKGFFVMIEGSRIDHAGHANDPAAQVHEVLAYDKTMAAVLDFIQHSDVPTLMVSTSDHETGGLAVARQLHETYPDYLWHPAVLANASHSASHTAAAWSHHLDRDDDDDDRATLTTLIHTSLGISDPSPDELNALLAHHTPAAYLFADMISRRAQTGWSTHGHSGADVNIYTSDRAAAGPALRGNRENTDVGAFLRDFLGPDVVAEVPRVSRLLRDHARVGGAAAAFLGTVPAVDERLDGQDHLDLYHGDHKTKRCRVCGL